MKGTHVRFCSITALVLGGFSAGIAILSIGVFLAKGPGIESFTYANQFADWTECIALLILPFAIISAREGRRRTALAGCLLCIFSWFVTFNISVNTFHGDRTPPSYNSAVQK